MCWKYKTHYYTNIELLHRPQSNGIFRHNDHLPIVQALMSEVTSGLEELEVVLERSGTEGPPLMPGEWSGEAGPE